MGTLSMQACVILTIFSAATAIQQDNVIQSNQIPPEAELGQLEKFFSNMNFVVQVNITEDEKDEPIASAPTLIPDMGTCSAEQSNINDLKLFRYESVATARWSVTMASIVHRMFQLEWYNDVTKQFQGMAQVKGVNAYHIQDLSPDSPYEVTLTAIDANGNYIGDTSRVTLDSYLPPVVDEFLDITQDANYNLILDWSFSNSIDVVKYKIEWGGNTVVCEPCEEQSYTISNYCGGAISVTALDEQDNSDGRVLTSSASFSVPEPSLELFKVTVKDLNVGVFYSVKDECLKVKAINIDIHDNNGGPNLASEIVTPPGSTKYSDTILMGLNCASAKVVITLQGDDEELIIDEKPIEIINSDWLYDAEHYKVSETFDIKILKMFGACPQSFAYVYVHGDSNAWILEFSNGTEKYLDEISCNTDYTIEYYRGELPYKTQSKFFQGSMPESVGNAPWITTDFRSSFPEPIMKNIAFEYYFNKLVIKWETDIDPCVPLARYDVQLMPANDGYSVDAPVNEIAIPLLSCSNLLVNIVMRDAQGNQLGTTYSLYTHSFECPGDAKEVCNGCIKIFWDRKTNLAASMTRCRDYEDGYILFEPKELEDFTRLNAYLKSRLAMTQVKPQTAFWTGMIWNVHLGWCNTAQFRDECFHSFPDGLWSAGQPVTNPTKRYACINSGFGMKLVSERSNRAYYPICMKYFNV